MSVELPIGTVINREVRHVIVMAERRANYTATVRCYTYGNTLMLRIDLTGDGDQELHEKIMRCLEDELDRVGGQAHLADHLRLRACIARFIPSMRFAQVDGMIIDAFTGKERRRGRRR